MEGKKVCILMGSPCKSGNTIQITRPFMEEMEARGHACELIWLYDAHVLPCVACRACQKEWSVFGCWQRDDMQSIADAVLACGLLVLATPIYSWYCTPPLKAALDRLVYGMNKYYGERNGPTLWAGKKLALIATCGYPPEKGADLWEAGMVRYCKHSQLHYEGMLVERHMGYRTPFMDAGKEERARRFARTLAQALADAAAS